MEYTGTLKLKLVARLQWVEGAPDQSALSLFPLANRKLPLRLVRTRTETSVGYFETLAHGESHTHTHNCVKTTAV